MVEQVGDVNILFNNAGVRRVRPFLQHTNLQIEKVINTNLYGQVRQEEFNFLSTTPKKVERCGGRGNGKERD